jgi:metal-responsive CopG/Arc/MetJ family transcriptional regulator
MTAGHENEIRISFWLDIQTAAEFDDAIEINHYKNRADWFREKVRQEIEKASEKASHK